MVEYPERPTKAGTAGQGLDRVYVALAHPIRRRMLGLLAERSCRVTDLAAPFDVSLAAASKHIRVLEGAGLIDRTIAGRDHVLSLAPGALDDAGAWIERARSFWNGRLDALEAEIRRQR